MTQPSPIVFLLNVGNTIERERLEKFFEFDTQVKGAGIDNPKRSDAS
jgi:hypothetical protein